MSAPMPGLPFASLEVAWRSNPDPLELEVTYSAKLVNGQQRLLRLRLGIDRLRGSNQPVDIFRLITIGIHSLIKRGHLPVHCTLPSDEGPR